MEFKPVFLLIEDNLIDQIVIKQLIRKSLDIEVNITNNGREGLLWLHDHENLNQPVIILLDIQMPIMNGLDFLEEFHKLSENFKKEIQIYVLSSTLDPDEIKRINENNYVTDFLNKPLQIEDFIKKIHL